MKTIHTYIVGDMMKTFVFAFIVFSFVLTIITMISMTLQENVPPVRLLEMIPFIIIVVAPITIPMTLLLAVTSTLARVSGNNEIVALKALGIPPWRVLWPVLVLAFVMSVACVWANDWAVTSGRANIAKIGFSAFEDMVLSAVRQDGIYTFPGGVGWITAKGVNNKTMIGVTIFMKKEATTISAQQASLRIDTARQMLLVSLYGIKAGEGNNVTYDAPEEHIEFSLERFGKSSGKSNRASDMGLRELPEAMERDRQQIESGRRYMAAQQAFATILGKPENLVSADWKMASANTEAAKVRLDRYAVEPPRRWANGFCCLFFVWVGAPLAVWMKKADIFASFFAVFIPILLFFYPFLAIGTSLAKSGTLPAEGVWIANAALGVAGIWFWKNIHRY
ncbi:MAG: LptF/LptG family permease [Planctomycetaceae bacterium]|jgi:lipopolysaccharide export system permease protein|nr:LptF/LptG family permease [Planctomycetaceae bacterium]